MSHEPKKPMRVSGAIRWLMGFIVMGLFFALIALLVPVPLPAWERAGFTLQFGLTILLLVCIGSLIWDVRRKK